MLWTLVSIGNFLTVFVKRGCMENYFEIAGVRIRIEADTAFEWDPHIKVFETDAFEQADEIYKIRMTDELHDPDGEIVYQGATCSWLKRAGAGYLSVS